MYLFKHFTFFRRSPRWLNSFEEYSHFSATDFSEIIYRLTTRQLVVNIGHKSCENKQSIKAQFQFSEDLEAGGGEVTSSDIGAICETSGCDPDQVIGVLLELNILASIKLNPPPPISCKGV